MQINDLLADLKYKEARLLLLSEMESTAGEKLVGQMQTAFGTVEKAMDFYYSPIEALGGIRPYDLCKRGNEPDLADLLRIRQLGSMS